MVDVTSEKLIATPAGAEPAAGDVASQYESDFSLRKIRVALTILLGQTFATSMLPFIALPLLLVPMTQQFGWTPKEFSYATTSLMFVGAPSVFFLGYIVDRVGCRPIIILGTLLVGLVTILISQTVNLLTFCIGFGALGFFGSTGMVYSKVVAALFTRHRGKALAILGAEIRSRICNRATDHSLPSRALPVATNVRDPGDCDHCHRTSALPLP